MQDTDIFIFVEKSRTRCFLRHGTGCVSSASLLCFSHMGLQTDACSPGAIKVKRYVRLHPLPVKILKWLIVNCPQSRHAPHLFQCSKCKNTHSHKPTERDCEKEEEKESLISLALNCYTWENIVTTKPPSFSLQQLLCQCSLDSLEEEMLGKFFHNVVILSIVFLFFPSVFYVRLVRVIFLAFVVYRANRPAHGIRGCSETSWGCLFVGMTFKPLANIRNKP